MRDPGLGLGGKAGCQGCPCLLGGMQPINGGQNTFCERISDYTEKILILLVPDNEFWIEDFLLFIIGYELLRARF
jgi:hypothetical protein